MSRTETPTATTGRAAARDLRMPVVLAVLVGAALLRPALASVLDAPALANWSTVFLALVVQATPFLVLGVLVSAAIAAYVPADAITRWLPDRASLAVPVAAAAGAALPGCECSSVPIAGRLVSRGVPAAAALAFLLSAPAINPVVLVATAVAFPNDPSMVLARLLASLLAATVVGWIWVRIGRADLLAGLSRHQPSAGSGREVFLSTAQHDFLNAGGFLVAGAAVAATLQTIVPRSVLQAVAGSGPLALLALGLLAVVMALCSEADAFVAASLSQFSMRARLAFLVVGPMVDVKLIAMQAGTFGRAFALRFAPLTFAVAVAAAALVGWWLL